MRGRTLPRWACEADEPSAHLFPRDPKAAAEDATQLLPEVETKPRVASSSRGPGSRGSSTRRRDVASREGRRKLCGARTVERFEPSDPQLLDRPSETTYAVPTMFRILAPYVIALVLVLMTLGVLTHSHIDIFPCSRESFIYGAGRGGYGMQPPRENAHCDLMFLVDREQAIDNQKLDATGRALAVFVGVVLPAAIGFFVGRALTRKKGVA
jgi:hypothetical protein